jgi:hypothetical protein
MISTMRTALAIVLAAGCTFSVRRLPLGSDDGGGGAADARTGVDAPPRTADAARPPDARLDAAIPDAAIPDAHLCDPFTTYTPANFDPCAAGKPGVAITINSMAVWDTDSGILSEAGVGDRAIPSVVLGQTNGPSVRLVALDGLTVAGTANVQITGSKALAIMVFGDVTIAGTIDASAMGGLPGNGATSQVACIASVAPVTASDATSGSGGGAGGSFGTKGGNGGNGSGNGGTKGTSANMTGMASLTPLVTGCGGAPGANGPDPGAAGGTSGTAGGGGGGGGAIQISAQGTITITGMIKASGGGGFPGITGTTINQAGAGGGGSGGAILLEGDVANVNSGAFLCANGGAGGEGGSGAGTAPVSNPGQDGLCDAAMTAAAGGNGGSDSGGNGGNGSSGSGTGGDAQDGAASSSNGGAGGGGGGGAGRIRVHGATTRNINGGSTVSPGATS